MPLTLILQAVNGVVLACAGAAGVAASRHSGGFPGRYRVSWRMAGLALLLIGVSATLQNVHGARAVLHGEGSRAWAGYMRWAPAWNHSRETVPFALAFLLFGYALAARDSRLDRRWIPPLVLVAASAMGAGIGWLEGSLDFALHFQRVAVLDSLALLLLVCALASAMVTDVVDRLLIAFLLAYAIPLPLNALWFAWMAAHVDAGWRPSAVSMQLYRLAFGSLCMGLAVRRWTLARRGAFVHGLLVPSPPARPSAG